jgi:hypothetical protein
MAGEMLVQRNNSSRITGLHVLLKPEPSRLAAVVHRSAASVGGPCHLPLVNPVIQPATKLAIKHARVKS